MGDNDHDKIIRLEEGQKNQGENIDGLNRDRRFLVVAVIAQVIVKAMDYLKAGQ